MSTLPRGARRALAGTAGLAVAMTALAPFAISPAAAASPGLVISEVYGGGGNSGATFKNDFIELHNPTDAPISVDGMSVQYRSSGSSSAATGVTALTGSVPAGGHYLVQQAAGANGTVDLPTPDATGNTAMSGSAFTVWLAEGTRALDPEIGDVVAAPTAGVVDLVGVNSNTFETEKTPGASNTVSLARPPGGKDTDVNAADFLRGDPTPVGTGGGIDPEPQPDPVAATIAEIQGQGRTTPYDGRPVITEGVVTAAYPSGGFYGFYLQTPGTGGPTDPSTRTASDGLFVYQDRAAGAVTVAPGDRVRVTGDAGEYAGATQVTVTDAADIQVLATGEQVPAPVTGQWPATDAEKEALEGMLLQPTGAFTVSDTYSTNSYGEVGLAVGDRPLVQPTQVVDAQDAEGVAAVAADNAARAIVLDDGSSTNFANSSWSNGYTPTNGHLTPAYVSNAEPVRVGASATFDAPVVLTEGGSPSAPTYRLQPTATVVGPDNEASPITVEDTRTAAPDRELLGADGTPDLQVASFNVLNYFTTLGDGDDDNVGDGGCLAYNDKTGDGNNTRTGCDQRGAWDPEDFERQQEKIVAAISALDADVVGLMEIENSAVLGEQADEATRSLVAALNDAAGSEVWAANPSSADLPPTSEMDVITNAIIYRVDSVERVGEARALGSLSASGQPFDNAREPIAQAFRSVAGGEPVLVVVNHFKSKGSGTDDGTGQGKANPDRIAQAEALADWVPSVQEDLGVEATLLIGDFNAYAMEDPLQVLYGEGYTNVEVESGNDEHSYLFGGLVGSLDHVLANDAAMELYTGVDVWNINSGESIALEYSRWNYHSTDFHEPTVYRSSDHDPVVVGLDVVDERAPVTLAVKATPTRVWAGRTRVRVHVSVGSEAGDPTGSVSVTTDDGRTFEGTLDADGVAHVDLPPFPAAGEEPLVVAYAGDDERQDGQASVVVEVDTK